MRQLNSPSVIILFQRKPGFVLICINCETWLRYSDNFTVRQMMLDTYEYQELVAPWAIQMKAVSSVEPMRLVQSLTGAILGCGGWVLSRAANNNGKVNVLFEFERQSCLDIYSVLVAAGVELSSSGHSSLTEICRCTFGQGRDCRAEIASVDLEIQTYPEEVLSAARRRQTR
jgi:hypothetical protein